MKTIRNDGNYLVFECCNVFFDISKITDRHLRIDFICSKIPKRGNGSVALKSLCAYADSAEKTLSLLPCTNSGIPIKELKKWYNRNGFVDYDDGMIRYPLNGKSNG